MFLVLGHVWLQPDTVTAKHLILFSLCEDVLHVKEAALNEEIIAVDRGCGVPALQCAQPVVILLLAGAVL